MTHIEPELIAYADQRIASCAAFLDSMIAGETTDVLFRGAGDSLAVCALSNDLETHLTAKGALSDALALAIRRLAAQA